MHVAEYLGSLSVKVLFLLMTRPWLADFGQANSLEQRFVGQQLGPNEVLTKCQTLPRSRQLS